MKSVSEWRRRFAPSASKEQVVSTLYRLLGRSLVALAAFSLFMTYFLYDQIGTPILVWEATLLLLILLRAFSVYGYFRYRERLSIAAWHRIFFGLALLTAATVSWVGAGFIFLADDFYKIFIVTSLIGLTSGASGSLMPDIRIMVAYVLIILLPMLVSLFVLGETVYVALGVMMVLYIFSGLAFAFQLYRSYKESETHRDEKLEAQEELFKEREAFEFFYTQSPIATFTYDLDLRIVECNRAFLSMFRIDKEEIIGISMKNLPESYPWQMAQAALEMGKQHYSGAYTSLKGYRYWIDAKAFPLHNSKGDVIGGFVLIEDKTREHEAIEELRRLARHDSLTSLYNRRMFHEFMDELIGKEEHRNTYSGIFYLDLNRFKYINDTLGHHFGDQLLVEVAKRIRDLAEETHMVARLGGDEFVVVTPFIAQHREEAQRYCQRFAGTIAKAFDPPFEIDDIRLYLQTSIGVVIIEPGEEDTEEILRHADISMYQAKSQRHETVAYYDTTLDTLRKETFALQQDLMQALQRDDFELFFQPIVSSKTHTSFAAEALIRWRHPKKGILPPASFIPLAVELGIITEIGDWVVEETFRTIRDWKRRGIWTFRYISINIDAKQLIHKDFFKRFAALMDRYGIEEGEITVEVTETSLIDNFDLTNEVLEKLKARGVRCAIDDFGTGYSSLSYLKKLSFSILKIDRAFMHELIASDENMTLIRTFMGIAEEFHYDIVLEGIEEPIQLERLKTIREDFSYQGFLVSMPLEKRAFETRFLNG